MTTSAKMMKLKEQLNRGDADGLWNVRTQLMGQGTNNSIKDLLEGDEHGTSIGSMGGSTLLKGLLCKRPVWIQPALL